MKTKIPFLLAVTIFVATVSKAQYPGGHADNRVIIQGRVVIPGVAVAVNYNSQPRERYVDYRDKHAYGRNDNRRDWREIAYERYCRDRRNYRMSREEFYRTRYGYQPVPYYSQYRNPGCRE